MSAVDLGVFKRLAGGPPVEALRTSPGLHSRSAGDFFGALGTAAAT